MNILITGASGFIASQIVTDLLMAGHRVTCCARNISYTKNIFPKTEVLPCDFIHDTSADDWLPRLKNIDAVINCVGIFYHPNKKIIWAIHHDTPCALFDACVQMGIKKIIHISALGVDIFSVEYAKSKKTTDDYLLTLPIPSVVLRPSLVYGKGSYGGTSLFRGLVGLPGVIPIPGKGTQTFQPIHLQDLSKAAVTLVDASLTQSVLLNAVGPEQITLKEMLVKLRAWLGFSKARILFVPLRLMRLGSWMGDLIPYSAMNTTAYKMLNQNNVTDEKEVKKFHETIGFVPRDFSEGVMSQPSTVQDHWHARLFFLKPLLQMSLAFLWIATAICSAFLYSKSGSYYLLSQVGVNHVWQPVVLYGASLLDAMLGVAMLLGYQLRKVCVIQISIILIYSALVAWKLPYLWIEPFAPLIKNIPVIVATGVLLAMESDR